MMLHFRSVLQLSPFAIIYQLISMRNQRYRVVKFTYLDVHYSMNEVYQFPVFIAKPIDCWYTK